MYQLTEHGVVVRLSDNARIPEALDNKDYCVYLGWVADGNEPLPADRTEAKSTARGARNMELDRADVMLNRAADGEKGIGTQKAWREYRIALRNWPDTDSFPDVMPTAPDKGAK